MIALLLVLDHARDFAAKHRVAKLIGVLEADHVQDALNHGRMLSDELRPSSRSGTAQGGLELGAARAMGLPEAKFRRQASKGHGTARSAVPMPEDFCLIEN
ncbi:hypothetical protein [Bradyrhizobium sp. CB2312]|uniref:hypothetical protein n=1 Tax=Bradyrhizobium sp. CB2312 TaxID=3039155 RepID=UPI0024B19451|nr:hypothetical protein [Bradyrhizobium sp. CB2312]WFU75031.1 hypothetical protein QA642_13870 [Bradyrhizobium sp. CB2312]